MFEIERITHDLRETVAELDPARLDGRDAARLAEAAAEGAKLLDTATAMLAKRAADTNAWRSRTHAASPEQWLAEATGTSEAAAREMFATTTRLSELPATEKQLRAGDLSLQQAAHVTAGASADPSSEQRLLATARRSGMRELRAERERVIAAACDEVEARRRARARPPPAHLDRRVRHQGHLLGSHRRGREGPRRARAPGPQALRRSPPRR